MLRPLPPAFLPLIAPFLAPVAVLATTWTVNPSGTGDFGDIQSAILAAAGGDEILLEDGVYSGPGNRNMDFLGKAITIRSASGNPAACTIDFDGGGTWRWGFEFGSGEGPSSIVADVSLVADDVGSIAIGCRVYATSPTIRNVRFATHSAVWCEGGSPRLESSVLENGTNLFFSDGAAPVVTGCVWEAGALLESRGRVRVYDSTFEFEDCTGQEGGFMIANSNGAIRGCELVDTRVFVIGDGVDVALENCRFTGGRDVYFSGTGSSFSVIDTSILGQEEEGIESLGDNQLTIDGCVIQGNGRRGLLVYGSRVDMRRSLVSGNRDGGLIVWSAGNPAVSLTLEECTVASNGHANVSGGAAYLGPGVDATMRRSLLWGNCASFGSAAWIADGTLDLDCVNVDMAGIEGGGSVQTVGDPLQDDPLFCGPIDCTSTPQMGGDYTLAADSPALLQDCGEMGGQGAGCGAISVESATWAEIKARYR